MLHFQLSLAFPRYTEPERIDLANWYDELHLSNFVVEKFKAKYPHRPIPSKAEIIQCNRKLHQFGTVRDLPRTGRPKSYGKADEEKIIQAFQKSPTKSLYQASCEKLGSSEKIRRVLKNANMKPYKMRILHQLVYGDREKRVTFCRDMLRLLEDDSSAIDNILFGDEAYFHLNGFVNHQNFRYWSDEKPEENIIELPLHSPKIMTWAGIMRRGLVGPFFFEGNVSGASYLQMLETQLMPTLDAIYGDNLSQMMFMHDGAPAHYSQTVKNYLKEWFPGTVIGRNSELAWPPRSPDLTPCDYFLWGHLKTIVRSRKPHDILDLRIKIIEAATNVTSSMIQNVLEDFRHRLSRCIEKNGDHIE